MNLDSLEKLYVHELKDLYSAENQIIEALPRMIDAAQDSDLKSALQHHLGETKTHVNRVQTLFKDLDFEPGGHQCKGMKGLIDEGKEVLQDVTASDVVDAAIVSACQRIEHYEIAAYGVARAFAQKLGRHKDAEVLTRTIEEEGAADRKLTSLAERYINFVAATATV